MVLSRLLPRRALLGLPLLAATLLAQAPPSQAPPSPGVVRPRLIPATPMMNLQHSFKVAKPPKPEDLVGTWILVLHIMTPKFLQQSGGSDHVTFDKDGIRRDKNPSTPLEWTMTISSRNGHLSVTSHTQWEPSGDSSPVTFNADGDMLFKKDYGSDHDWIYRCRASSPTRLVCLLKDHEAGHGLGFEKAPLPSGAKPKPAPAH